MDFIVNIIGVIIALFILYLVFYKKIVALFATVVLSKVISIVLCLLATGIGVFWIYFMVNIGIPEAGTVVDYSTPEGKISMIAGFCPFASILLTARAWLFYSGARIFDVEYTGSFKLYDVGDGYVPVPKERGGFLGNLGVGIVISAIFWGFALGGYIEFSLVPSLGIMIWDIIKLIKAWRERDEY